MLEEEELDVGPELRLGGNELVQFKFKRFIAVS